MLVYISFSHAGDEIELFEMAKNLVNDHEPEEYHRLSRASKPARYKITEDHGHRLIQEYVPAERQLRFGNIREDDRRKLNTQLRPDQHHGAIDILPCPNYGISVYSFNNRDANKIHISLTVNKRRLCYWVEKEIITASDRNNLSLSISTGDSMFTSDDKEYYHCLVYPTKKMKLRDFDRLWEAVSRNWRECNFPRLA